MDKEKVNEIKKSIAIVEKFIENDAYIKYEKEILTPLNHLISSLEELIEINEEK